jgi:hypothetical protein
MLALLTVVVGLVLCWLLMAVQQYAFDELTGGQLPYVPDAWYGTYGPSVHPPGTGSVL